MDNGLEHVYYQDSLYWSVVISNIKASLGIRLDRVLNMRFHIYSEWAEKKHNQGLNIFKLSRS